MSTTITPPAETKSFDPLAFNRQRNEREAAERSGAAPKPGSPEPVAAAKPAEELDDEEKAHAGLPRSARREINKLRNEAGELRGRLAALQEMFEKQGMKPSEAKTEAAAVVAEEPDAKPDRAKFASDAEHIEALGAWSARQEHKKAEASRQWVEHVMSMSEKAEADAALIPDYEEHKKAAEEGTENYVPWNMDEHRQFTAWLIANEYRALAMDYFATRPDELREVLALTTKPGEQAKELMQLDGYLKREYRKLQNGAKAEPKGKAGAEEAGKTAKATELEKVKTAPKLPPPSESAAVRGGSAPAVGVSPTLGDGKTINPAWVAARNEREGRR